MRRSLGLLAGALAVIGLAGCPAPSARCSPRATATATDNSGWAVTGRRLDGSTPPARGQVPSGYGDTGFQSNGVIFPTAGCWVITGKVGSTSLTFVTLVVS
jgi:hypothetical protein